MRAASIRIEQYRRVHPTLGRSEGMYGYFRIGNLHVISSGLASNDCKHGDWEHVSVSCEDRCPTWEEMQRVKELFWRDDETVIQFHPPKSEYVNHHQYCLHLWKPPYSVELPSKEMIA